MLIPDSTTIGSKQYPKTEITAPIVTSACVAITLNNAQNAKHPNVPIP